MNYQKSIDQSIQSLLITISYISLSFSLFPLSIDITTLPYIYCNSHSLSFSISIIPRIYSLPFIFWLCIHFQHISFYFDEPPSTPTFYSYNQSPCLFFLDLTYWTSLPNHNYLYWSNPITNPSSTPSLTLQS